MARCCSLYKFVCPHVFPGDNFCHGNCSVTNGGCWMGWDAGKIFFWVPGFEFGMFLCRGFLGVANRKITTWIVFFLSLVVVAGSFGEFLWRMVWQNGEAGGRNARRLLQWFQRSSSVLDCKPTHCLQRFTPKFPKVAFCSIATLVSDFVGIQVPHQEISIRCKPRQFNPRVARMNFPVAD